MRNSACECTLCPLHETALTVCMAPYSPADPLFAVVGEAPGAEEDKLGEPFVGASGRLLWETLEEFGLAKDQAHVTNAVKCRPPENKTPTKKQQNTCRTYLDAELDWLRWESSVKAVLALGATAYQALGGKGGIRDNVGVLYEYNGLTIIPCLHPAAALRSPQQMANFKETVAYFAQIVKAGGIPKAPEVNVRLVNDEKTLREMVSALEFRQTIAFDLETIGLDEEHPRAGIICFALCGTFGESWVVLWDHPDNKVEKEKIKEALDYLFRLDKSWVAQNGKFDCRWLHKFGFVVPDLSADTMFMAHLLDENSPKNVESLAVRYLGVAPWGGEMKEHFVAVTKALDKGTSIPYPPLDVLVQYAGLDAEIEWRLAHTLWKKMSADQKRMHDFMIDVCHVLIQAERLGVPMDPEELERAQERAEEAASKAEAVFHALPGCEGVNLNSPQQLVVALFDNLGLPIAGITANGQPSTNEHSMKKLRRYAPEPIGALLDYRRHTKRIGSYLRPWRSLLNTVTNRLRCQFSLTGTVTGRLSCTNTYYKSKSPGMSLHQVPRDGEIRTVVSAPPGRKLLVADYSQIELRVAAAFAKERRMIEAYMNGEDLHRLTASTVMGKKPEDVTKEDRQNAKAVNFGFLYGMGARNFVDYAFDTYDLEFTLEESQELRRGFFALYPGLRSWHKSVEETVRRYGYVRSPLGRIRHLPDIHSPDKRVSAEAVRQAINSPVQATASDFTLMAMLLTYEWGQENNIPLWIIGQVHDSIMVEVDESVADEVAHKVKTIMEQDVPQEVKERFGYRFPLPLAAEVIVSQKWGEAEIVLAD